eukprot:CAMPEP_0119564628 /NCGR_PEP_ID=MMETSP1352-20130426/27586_1 /TAXON_ID=265584 /ORGANISM="Stauroneis constricta, Strain CCMP1120" /LENGTH=68 /DNA_ID=CAMNT_0007613403 /DNA_START=35 /DNA_END=238 /DNA_ORIENTATION=-
MTLGFGYVCCPWKEGLGEERKLSAPLISSAPTSSNDGRGKVTSRKSFGAFRILAMSCCKSSRTERNIL